MSAQGVDAPLRLGLVGCGRLAEMGYVAAAARADGLDLVAVADPDPLRRQHVAGLVARTCASVTTWPDAAALVAGAAPDVVVVASPVGCHVADARVAVNAGIPVLVEKPVAPDADQAAEIAALAPQPWVGFNRRFDPGARRVRAAARGRDHIELRAAISYRRRSWRAHRVRDEALLDLGPHVIDWARWVIGADPVEVFTLECAPERATLDLVFERARARVSLATDRLHHEVLDVRDARHRRVARHQVGGPLGAVRGRFERGDHPLVATLTAQLEQLALAVRGRPSDDLATATDGVVVMATLDAARESAARGGRIPVRRRWET